jgi:O-antigen/teichoic acid export membrane protein
VRVPGATPAALLKRGVAWNYAASATTLAAQISYTALTARFLTPSDFGAYATAQVLLSLLGYVALSTLATGLIRLETANRKAVGTALRLALCFGTAAMCVGLLAAPAWARLWSAPESETLILVFAPVALLTPVAAVPLALLRRELRFRRAATIETGAQLSGFLAGATLAVTWQTPVALVLGQLLWVSVVLGAGSLSVRSALSLGYDRAVAKQLLTFAVSVSGQNLAYFLIYNAPALAVARFAGVAALGAYSRANTIVSLPAVHLAQGLTKALYPLYSRGTDRGAALVWSALTVVTAFTWPVYAVVAAGADPIVRALLGPGWGQAAAILPLLALFAAVNLAFVVVGNPLEAHRHFAVTWLIQAGWGAGVMGVIAVAFARGFDLMTFLVAIILVQVGAHGAQVLVADRLGFIRAARLLRLYLLRVPIAVGWYAGTAALLWGLAAAPLPLRVVAVALVAACAAGLAALRARRTRDVLPAIAAERS